MVYSATEIKKMQRVMRRPQHPFQVRYRPFTLQPVAICPVLPGETMKHAMLQARTVSDPIKNPLVGWWNEYWVFYVKLRDLAERDNMTAMLLNPGQKYAGTQTGTNIDTNHEDGSGSNDVDYVKLCLNRVTDEYFRYEGERYDTTGTILTSVGGNDMPMAQIVGNNFTDSAIDDVDYIQPLDENLASASAGQGDGTTGVYASEIKDVLVRYQLELEQGLTQMSYEEYCASYYGETAKEPELNKPELLRYIRDWTYPTNTIDTTNGTPRSAVSWVTQATVEKARFFKEPGFIFVVTSTRPKVYLSSLSCNAVSRMRDAKSWLPPSLMQDPYASMVKVPAGDPPITNATNAYWFDLKDLFVYGDQFTNFARNAANANFVTGPGDMTDALLKRYATSANIDAMFVSASPANQIWTDGIFTPSVAGRQTDTSPNTLGPRSPAG